MNKSTKIILLIVCVAVITFAVGIASGYGISCINKAQTTTSPSSIQGNASITADEAKAIAFKDAGVVEKDVENDSVYPDSEDGIKVFEVDFIALGSNYEYEIVAESGEIYSKKVNNFTSETVPYSDTTGTQENDKYIGADKAKAIAFENAGVSEKDVTFKKSNLEMDDGIMVYELEFIAGSMEYEYEIDAVTGNIHAKDIEHAQHH